MYSKLDIFSPKVFLDLKVLHPKVHKKEHKGQKKKTPRWGSLAWFWPSNYHWEWDKSLSQQRKGWMLLPSSLLSRVGTLRLLQRCCPQWSAASAKAQKFLWFRLNNCDTVCFFNILIYLIDRGHGCIWNSAVDNKAYSQNWDAAPNLGYSSIASPSR